jgi:hypothetical protein
LQLPNLAARYKDSAMEAAITPYPIEALVIPSADSVAMAKSGTLDWRWSARLD